MQFSRLGTCEKPKERFQTINKKERRQKISLKEMVSAAKRLKIFKKVVNDKSVGTLQLEVAAQVEAIE